MTASGSTRGSGRRPGATTSTTAPNRNWLRGSAGALVVLATLGALAPLSSSLATIGQTGAFTFEAAHLAGKFDFNTAAPTALIVHAASPDDAIVDVAIVAEELVVNTTSSAWLQAGQDPDDPSQATASVSTGPPRYREDSHRNASAATRLAAKDSHLLAVFDRGLLSGKFPEGLMVSPSTGEPWRAGAGANSSGGSAGGTTRQITVQQGLPQGNAPRGAAHFSGNFSVVFWFANVSVEAADGSNTAHFSGPATRSAIEGAPNQTRPLARQRVDQLVVIRAVNATMLLSGSRPFSFAAPMVQLEGTGDAAFQAAYGTVVASLGREWVVGHAVNVAGDFRLAVEEDGTQGDMLAGSLEVQEGALWASSGMPAHGRVTVTRTGGIPNGSGSDWKPAVPSALMAAAVVLVIGGLAIGVRSRLETVRIDDVELALLLGRPRRARLGAALLLRRDPRDADALFLLGAAFFQQRSLGRAVRALEARVSLIDPSRRRGIAFLLCLAHARLGHHAEALKWAREAREDPLLRERLHSEGLVPDGKHISPETDRMAYA